MPLNWCTVGKVPITPANPQPLILRPQDIQYEGLFYMFTFFTSGLVGRFFRRPNLEVLMGQSKKPLFFVIQRSLEIDPSLLASHY